MLSRCCRRAISSSCEASRVHRLLFHGGLHFSACAAKPFVFDDYVDNFSDMSFCLGACYASFYDGGYASRSEKNQQQNRDAKSAPKRCYTRSMAADRSAPSNAHGPRRTFRCRMAGRRCRLRGKNISTKCIRFALCGRTTLKRRPAASVAFSLPFQSLARERRTLQIVASHPFMLRE